MLLSNRALLSKTAILTAKLKETYFRIKPLTGERMSGIIIKERMFGKGRLWKKYILLSI